jgi:hypothetical protein
MKMERTELSETSAYKIQTPGNYPEENIQLASCCSRDKEAGSTKLLWYFSKTAKVTEAMNVPPAQEIILLGV